MKIKYKSVCQLEFSKKGEWIDLSTINDTTIVRDKKNFYGETLIDLGIAMQLPKEFEAIVVPRSSTFDKWRILLKNSVGVIDNSYCGDNDYWKFNAICFDKCTFIPKFTRIAQFRIQPSQKAGFLTKLKWLFTKKIEFIQVETLDNPDRGGFGSTGD